MNNKSPSTITAHKADLYQELESTGVLS